MSGKVVIIGASHAGAQAAVSLRQGGWDGDIAMIGDEVDYPYHRPPLSKDFLSGQKTVDDILLRPEAAYEASNIDLYLGHRAGSIDRKRKTVLTDTGKSFKYSKLILATGARVRRLPIEGEGLDHVYYLRNTVDVRAIQKAAHLAQRAVIIGGGYIGLETAASLRKLGLDVTVLEAMPRILQRVTAPELSAFYKRVHTEEGVTILENVMASKISSSQAGLTVLTSCQKEFPADMVIIGIGVIPNTDLAEAAGLTLGNGIEVNGFCQTSDPDIYAAGDVTWHYNPIYDRHIRLESVPNATEQAKIVASHINGDPKVYNSLPWFWSDQFDLKLQIAGLSDGYNNLVVRGNPKTGRSFAAYYFMDERFIAVDAVNAPRDFMFGKMALTKGYALDKEKLADLKCDLKACVI